MADKIKKQDELKRNLMKKEIKKDTKEQKEAPKEVKEQKEAPKEIKEKESKSKPKSLKEAKVEFQKFLNEPSSKKHLKKVWTKQNPRVSFNKTIVSLNKEYRKKHNN